MKIPKKIKVLDIGISQVTIENIVSLVPQFISLNKKGYVTVTGAHGIIESKKSDYIKKIHNDSFLSIPDGMPTVWVSKLKGSKEISRCFGPHTMIEVMKSSVREGVKHFFYGGNDGIAEELKLEMEKKFPGVDIVGTFCPPFRPLSEQEETELISLVKLAKPHIIWVGLSTPKQEIFMHEYIDRLDCNLMFGVGAAFDYHTNKLVIAPNWVQSLGLEWLFRLMLEPKRLWKRYFDIVPKFIFYNILELLKYK